VQTAERDGRDTAREPDLIGDICDGAHLREVVLVTGHQEHALVAAGVDGQRDVHVGEDDRVFQRYQPQGLQSFTFRSSLRNVSVAAG